jgi:hypothetical protein
MNRRDRRATGQRRSLADMERAAACPDCNADVTMTEVAPNVYSGTVVHADTCPWLAAFRRHGGLGMRFR